jgi:N-methylhydantoinase A
VVRVDAGGALKVGPESAGAVPGPACYAAGGTQATVTDANVVLGYLNPVALAGGTVPIDASLSRAAIDATVCQHLGCTQDEAAWGIHRLANAAMMRAVKAVSTYRGRDPRDFALFAFGGNGGIHAAALARELGMAQVIVPPGAGVFSAVGLLFTDHEVSRSAALGRPWPTMPKPSPRSRGRWPGWTPMCGRTRRASGTERCAGGQTCAITGKASNWAWTCRPVRSPPAWIEALRTAFEAEHRRSYGHDLGPHRIDLVTLRAIGTIPPQGPAAIAPAVAQTPAPAPETTRACWFGPEHGRIATPVIDRTALHLEPRAGPLIVEEYEGTTVVPPDATAQRDTAGNIVITLGAGVTHVA